MLSIGTQMPSKDSPNSIHLTRGDTAYLQIPIYTLNEDGSLGTEYAMSPNDILKLTVKRRLKDETVAFSKSVIGTNIIHILPEDTRACEFKEYIYDVQIETVDHDIFTVIGPETFEILPEVTI